MKVTISGSFRKHFETIIEFKKQFEKIGIEILSPKSEKIISNKKGFILLENDSGNINHIEGLHLKAIAESDILYVICNEGYIGSSTAMEIGFANALNLPIFGNFLPNDDVFKNLIKVSKPQHINLDTTEANDIIGKKKEEEPSDNFNFLDNLQNKIGLQAIRLGFEKETTQELILMALEELGELAAVERRRSGLAAANQRISDFADELADLIIYLISIANNEKILLSRAILKKMAINEQRKWITNNNKE